MNFFFKLLAICLVVHLSQAKTTLTNYEIVSDTTDWCVGPSNTGYCVPTFMASFFTAVIPGATWIWETAFVTNPTINQMTTITKSFSIKDQPVKGILYIATDNYVKFWINSVLVYSSTDGTWSAPNQKVIDVTPYINTEKNDIRAEVTNAAGSVYSYLNPGGLLYKLAYTVASSS